MFIGQCKWVAMRMISIVVQCYGVKLFMINIVVQFIGIALLMIKHCCAMYGNCITDDLHYAMLGVHCLL